VNARTNRWVIAAAIAALILAAILSSVIELGRPRRKIMLTTNTPALRLSRKLTASIALLAHGGGGSKEMLFRFGEAFAAAGFDCVRWIRRTGESPDPIALTNPCSHSRNWSGHREGGRVHRPFVGRRRCRVSVRIWAFGQSFSLGSKLWRHGRARTAAPPVDGSIRRVQATDRVAAHKPMRRLSSPLVRAHHRPTMLCS
jgi:hypothetical protein